MKMIIVLPLMVVYSCLSAGENASIDYIQTYKHIAISEMERTGIPASIKMAQALLESGSGKSTLATQANNHFGIKCGGKWTGDTFYREDDDYKNGKLIASCFRKFKTPSQSFFAHSDFLVNQNRYAFLFEYGTTDYLSWAHGLKKAGYATDKAYPSKLIHIIEKYELYNLDNGTVAAYASSTPAPTKIRPEAPPAAEILNEESPEPILIASTDDKAATTIKEDRSQTRASAKRKKNRKYSKKENTSEMVFHVVQVGQTLSEIAMIHDLDETMMRLRNRIPKDAEPLSGEKIFLRKKISFFNRPAFSRVPTNGAVVSQDEYIF